MYTTTLNDDKISALSMIQRIIALILFVLLIPLLCILYIFIKFNSKVSFLFKQLRLGKNKKPFHMYKIRTMIPGAEKLQQKYSRLNEADGPVFKIRNDPRYTRVGKWLSHTGLDELPQLLNIIKGEMAFVGPRPLPIQEAQKIPKKFNKRFYVLPGITSLWSVSGAHTLSFHQWMKLDCFYATNHNLLMDIKIAVKTIILVVKNIFSLNIKINQSHLSNNSPCRK